MAISTEERANEQRNCSNSQSSLKELQFGTVYPLLTAYSKALARKNIILDWKRHWNFCFRAQRFCRRLALLLLVPIQATCNFVTKRHLYDCILHPLGDGIQALQLQSRTSSFGTFCLISLSSSTACLTRAANTSFWKTTEVYLRLLWFYF